MKNIPTEDLKMRKAALKKSIDEYQATATKIVTLADAWQMDVDAIDAELATRPPSKNITP